jgi:hypothetical protein
MREKKNNYLIIGSAYISEQRETTQLHDMFIAYHLGEIPLTDTLNLLR